MVFIKKIDGLHSIIQQGRLGRPMFCGTSICSWSQCGEDIEESGVYQNRHVRFGNQITGITITPKVKICKMKQCWPVFPYNVNRERTNNNFKNAVLAWNNLTNEQKEEYNTINAGKLKCGYNYFIKQQLHG